MLNIIPFTEKDVDKLYPIELACHQFPWSEKVFKSCIGGRYKTFMALEDDEPVAFYVVDLVADESTLMDICVAPTAQGKGYGKLLLEHCLNTAKEFNATTCWLEVRASNISAQMLYINAGFIQTGRRTGYYPANAGYEDAIVMKLNL